MLSLNLELSSYLHIRSMGIRSSAFVTGLIAIVCCLQGVQSTITIDCNYLHNIFRMQTGFTCICVFTLVGLAIRHFISLLTGILGCQLVETHLNKNCASMGALWNEKLE
eukprot:5016691-Amphidinium_carterae.1